MLLFSPRIETVNFEGAPFDLVITNVPFADVRIVDKAYDNKPYRIHDYFFKKAIDLVPYHGMVAAITSTGTADKGAGSILPELRRSGTQFLGGVAYQILLLKMLEQEW